MALLDNLTAVPVIRVVLGYVVAVVLLRFTCWLNNVLVRFMQGTSSRNDPSASSASARETLPRWTWSTVPVLGFGDAFFLLLLAILLFAAMSAVAVCAIIVPASRFEIDGGFLVAVFIIVEVLLFWLAHATVFCWLLPTNFRQAFLLAIMTSLVNVSASILISLIIDLVPWDYLELMYEGLASQLATVLSSLSSPSSHSAAIPVEGLALERIDAEPDDARELPIARELNG